jgi:hypothetical protein
MKTKLKIRKDLSLRDASYAYQLLRAGFAVPSRFLEAKDNSTKAKKLRTRKSIYGV